MYAEGASYQPYVAPGVEAVKYVVRAFILLGTGAQIFDIDVCSLTLHLLLRMQIAPLSVLAKWPTPNYKNPVTQGPENTIIISILLGIVTILIAIRLYARLRISKGFGLDDVLIILAYVRRALGVETWTGNETNKQHRYLPLLSLLVVL